MIIAVFCLFFLTFRHTHVQVNQPAVHVFAMSTFIIIHIIIFIFGFINLTHMIMFAVKFMSLSPAYRQGCHKIKFTAIVKFRDIFNDHHYQLGIAHQNH